jgi:hypothetical protein
MAIRPAPSRFATAARAALVPGLALVIGLAGTPSAHAADADGTRLVIPHGQHARTQADVFAGMKTFCQATIIAPLTAAPDQPGKAQALAAVTLAVRNWANEKVPDADVIAAAQAAIAAGSDDPMVLYVQARFANLPDDQTLDLFRRSAAGLAHATVYPPVRRALSDLHVLECLEAAHPRDDAAVAAAADAAETTMMAALAATRDDDRAAVDVIYDNFRDLKNIDALPGMGDRLLKDLAAPGIPPWWRDSLSALVHIDLAWQARGSGWASTVTPEGWKGFNDHLAAANTAVIAAWNRHPDRPQPAAVGITIAMGGAGGDVTVQQWFDRSVAAQMDYKPAYDALRNALLPRWGGSHEQMLALGATAADTNRYDTEVPDEYLKEVYAIYGDAISMKQPPPPLLHQQAVYDRCLAIIDRYWKKSHPDGTGDASYTDSQRAVVAWMCGQPKECLRWMDVPGDTPAPQWYRLVRMTPEQLHAAATAATGGAGATGTGAPKGLPPPVPGQHPASDF